MWCDVELMWCDVEGFDVHEGCQGAFVCAKKWFVLAVVVMCICQRGYSMSVDIFRVYLRIFYVHRICSVQFFFWKKGLAVLVMFKTLWGIWSVCLRGSHINVGCQGVSLYVMGWFALEGLVILIWRVFVLGGVSMSGVSRLNESCLTCGF